MGWNTVKSKEIVAFDNATKALGIMFFANKETEHPFNKKHVSGSDYIWIHINNNGHSDTVMGWCKKEEILGDYPNDLLAICEENATKEVVFEANVDGKLLYIYKFSLSETFVSELNRRYIGAPNGYTDDSNPWNNTD